MIAILVFAGSCDEDMPLVPIDDPTPPIRQDNPPINDDVEVVEPVSVDTKEVGIISRKLIEMDLSATNQYTGRTRVGPYLFLNAEKRMRTNVLELNKVVMLPTLNTAAFADQLTTAILTTTYNAPSFGFASGFVGSATISMVSQYLWNCLLKSPEAAPNIKCNDLLYFQANIDYCTQLRDDQLLWYSMALKPTD